MMLFWLTQVVLFLVNTLFLIAQLYRYTWWLCVRFCSPSGTSNCWRMLFYPSVTCASYEKHHSQKPLVWLQHYHHSTLPFVCFVVILSPADSVVVHVSQLVVCSLIASFFWVSNSLSLSVRQHGGTQATICRNRYSATRYSLCLGFLCPDQLTCLGSLSFCSAHCFLPGLVIYAIRLYWANAS